MIRKVRPPWCIAIARCACPGSAAVVTFGVGLLVLGAGTSVDAKRHYSHVVFAMPRGSFRCGPASVRSRLRPHYHRRLLTSIGQWMRRGALLAFSQLCRSCRFRNCFMGVSSSVYGSGVGGRWVWQGHPEALICLCSLSPDETTPMTTAACTTRAMSLLAKAPEHATFQFSATPRPRRLCRIRTHGIPRVYGVHIRRTNLVPPPGMSTPLTPFPKLETKHISISIWSSSTDVQQQHQTPTQ